MKHGAGRVVGNVGTFDGQFKSLQLNTYISHYEIYKLSVFKLLNQIANIANNPNPKSENPQVHARQHATHTTTHTTHKNSQCIQFYKLTPLTMQRNSLQYQHGNVAMQ